MAKTERSHFTAHTPEWDGQLKADDFAPQPVSVRFEDGSVATADSAFYRIEGEGPGEVVVVYTEHCGYWVFRRRAVEQVKGWQRRERADD